MSQKSVSKGGRVELERTLSLWAGISIVVGTMIGTGIFISPVGIIQESGSVGSSLLIWVLCGFISTMCALSFVELGLVINESGGEYSYCYRAFGDIIGFLSAWNWDTKRC